MASVIQQPFQAVFGSGAPGGSVPHSAMYFDTSTTPYTPYIYTAGAWAAFGSSGGGANATSIQGTPVDTGTPLNGQTLVYNSGTGKYELGSAGGVVATVVQSKAATPTTVSLGVTMTGAPTQNNILLAFVALGSSTFATANTGWARVWTQQETSSVNGSVALYYKVAGAAESATQTPVTNASAGAIIIYEISGCVAGPEAGQTYTSGTNTASPNLTCTKPSGGLIVGAVINTRSSALPTGITGTGVTVDGNSANGSTNFSVEGFHIPGAAQGANAVTVTFAANQTFCTMASQLA